MNQGGKESKNHKLPFKGKLTTVILLLTVLCIDISLLILKGEQQTEISEDATISRYISVAVISVIMAIFLYGVFNQLWKYKRGDTDEESMSSHLTAIGMLGTFVGIFIGLYYFDANNLKTSVPLLLEGMKIAFSTSIAGLVSSIGLKFHSSILIAIFIDETNEKSDLSSLNISLYDLKDSIDALYTKIQNLSDLEITAPGLEKNMVILTSAITTLNDTLKKSNFSFRNVQDVDFEDIK